MLGVRWAIALSVIPGLLAATSIALGLYAAYNLAGTIVSVPAGHVADRIGARGWS